MFKNLFSKPNTLTPAAVELWLQQYRSDYFPVGLSPFVSQCQVNAKSVLIDLSLPFPCASERATIETQFKQQFAMPIDLQVNLHVQPVRQHALTGVKNIIAVASGKGGVGKSTTSVNLALALQLEGAKVGLLDGDIYGPSIPTMLGIADQQPTSADGKTMSPLLAQGIYSMSIGYLMAENDATIWRGPMASSAFSQLLNETNWPDLDYLIVDLPPGTGDIQLTLAQKMPVAAAVVVTTPQDIALIDVNRALAMFDKVNVPVLGLVENMSLHICKQCGHESPIFGNGGATRLAKQQQVTLLGQLPLDAAICDAADQGECLTLLNSSSDIGESYRKIAKNVAAQLFYQLDMASPFTPELTIEE